MMPVLSYLNKQLMRPNKENHIFGTSLFCLTPITKSPNCFHCECGGRDLAFCLVSSGTQDLFIFVTFNPLCVDLYSYTSCFMVTKWVSNLQAMCAQSRQKDGRRKKGRAFLSELCPCEQEREALCRDSTSLTRISSYGCLQL